jgi:acetoin utilization deacetylase AcuC-like enzyme
MRVSYSPGYFVPLPENHRFPMGKFPALYRLLIAEGLVRTEDVIEPGEAEWADLLLVHTPEYISNLAAGTLNRAAERRLGLPWSEALVRRSRLAVQGTINAALMAMQDGVAANLAGGTHHAFADHGEGFCVLNDVAVAIRVLQQSDHIRRALSIDLDVHQGNGTAAIFAGDESVYTFSMHGENNYPFHKPPSSRDINLPDHTGDNVYLSTLAAHLPTVFEEARPDVVFYLAGVDPVAGDRFGRLALTREGLHQRERDVLEAVRRYGVPVALVLSGGYAATPEATADLHAIIHREAKTIFD